MTGENVPEIGYRSVFIEYPDKSVAIDALTRLFKSPPAPFRVAGIFDSEGNVWTWRDGLYAPEPIEIYFQVEMPDYFDQDVEDAFIGRATTAGGEYTGS